VDSHGGGALSDPVGAVLVRDPRQEARRVDAALGGEADQAAGALLASRHGGDEHRIVELRDELLEVVLRWTHAMPKIRVTPWDNQSFTSK
jgi:alpha-galactosidase/6-phospho-beta-glucosidase family protein